MEPKDRLKLVATENAANLPDGNSVSLAQRRGEAIAEIDNGNHDVPDLAAAFGLDQRDVRRLIPKEKKGVRTRGRRREPSVKIDPEAQEQPDPKNPTNPQPDGFKTQPEQSIAGTLIGAAFLAIGTAAAGVGGCINWQFGRDMAGLPGAVLGAVVDGGAMLFWPAAGELWRQRSWGLWLLAVLLGFPFVVGSTYAALNYTGVRLGDYFEARSHVKTARGEIETNIAEAEKRLGSEKRSIGEVEAAIRRARSFVLDPVLKATNECQTPTKSREACQGMTAEMDALANAKARDEWQAKIDGWKAELKGLATVASPNPAAEQVAEMSDSKITAAQAQNWWLRWLAAVPGFASIMLTIGFALMRKK